MNIKFTVITSAYIKHIENIVNSISGIDKLHKMEICVENMIISNTKLTDNDFDKNKAMCLS